MTMSKLKAAAKKAKFKKIIEAQERNDPDEQEEDSIDEMESSFIGTVINDNYLIVKYVGDGAFSRIWLTYHMATKDYRIIKIFLKGSSDEYKQEISVFKKIKNNPISVKHNMTYYETFIYKDDIENRNVYVIALPYLGQSLDEIVKDIEKKRRVYTRVPNILSNPQDNDGKGDGDDDFTELPLDKLQNNDELNNDDKCDYIDGNISLKESMYIIKGMLLGLRELHSMKLMHCDMKLDNILTKYYPKKVSKFIERFRQIDFEALRDTISTTILGELNLNYSEMNKNKKKKIRKIIKDKTVKKFKETIQSFVNKYMDDIDNEEIQAELDRSSNDLGHGSNDEEVDILKQEIILMDYSNATFESEIDDDCEYQIRAYRPPENILGYTYCYNSEIWTVGCILISILTGDDLFEPELTGSDEKRDREQLAIMEKYLGRISKDISLECPKSYELYYDSGRIKNHRKVEGKTNIHDYLSKERTDLTENEDEFNLLIDFLQKTLLYRWEMRISVDECLRHPLLLRLFPEDSL